MCSKYCSIIKTTITTIFIALIVLGISYNPNNSYAKVFISKEEALKLAFPDSDLIEKRSFFLDQAQIGSIEQLSRTKVDSRLFLLYVAKKDGEPVGYAAIDTHTVRTKTQTIIVVINPDGSLNYTEILAFFEPLEYKPTQRWIDLYKNKKIVDGLKIGYDIPNISGATLTSNGTANAVKKVLAIFEVVVNGA